jgi:hypothetical protein
VALAQLEPGMILITSGAQMAVIHCDPPNGRLESASEGAGMAARSVMNTPHLWHPYLEAVVGVIGAGVAPFAAGYGAIRAGQQRLSPDKLAEAERDLMQAMRANAGSEALREKVGRVAREKTCRVLVCAASGSAAPAGRVPVSAVLELAVEQLSLEFANAGKSEYSLHIGARARLLRSSDNTVLLDKVYQYRSGPALFIDWARHGGLESVAQTGYQSLAEQIAAQVFQPASETPLRIGPGQKHTLESNSSETGNVLEPRRGALFIAAPVDVHPLNPGGVACFWQRLRNNAIIGSAAFQSGHPYGVKKNVIVWVRGSITRQPLRGLKQLAKPTVHPNYSAKGWLMARPLRCSSYPNTLKRGHQAKLVLCQATRFEPRPTDTARNAQSAGEPSLAGERAPESAQPAETNATAIAVFTGRLEPRLSLVTAGSDSVKSTTGQTETQWALHRLDEDRNSVVQVVSCLAALPIGLWEQTVGAARKVWLDRTEKVAQTLDALPEQRRFADELADEVARRLRSRVINQVQRLEESPAFAFALPGDTPPTAAAGAQAATNSPLALHLQVVNASLSGKHASSRSRAFCAEIRATIIRTSDGQELYSRPILYRSSLKKLKDWAASDAKAFRQELEACSQRTAEALTDELIGRGFVTQ